MELNSREELFDLIKSNDVVFIDFYGNTCGPCKMFVPTFDRLVAEYNESGRATVAKIEVYERPLVAEYYNIKALPTLVVFKGGVEQKRFIGGKRLSEIKEEIEKAINGTPLIEQTDDF
jgi:thioredoxin 1